MVIAVMAVLDWRAQQKFSGTLSTLPGNGKAHPAG
jgi:hypothetical protein